MKKRGFTLIEMLIVIVIIGVLAGALIPRIGSARDKANDTAREANVRSLATAMVSYGLDHGYPTTASGIQDMSNYSIPSDNFANQPQNGDTYNYRSLDNEAHFVIYTDLSCATEENGECGNCSGGAVSTMDTFSAVNTHVQDGAGPSFCYFQ